MPAARISASLRRQSSIDLMSPRIQAQFLSEKGTFRFSDLRSPPECQPGKSGMSPFRPSAAPAPSV